MRRHEPERRLNSSFNPSQENAREQLKSVPDRYPSNADAIGIELVGEAMPRGGSTADALKTYEPVTAAQNAALQWLIQELSNTLNIPLSEVFRHPTVSRKNPTEASTARW